MISSAHAFRAIKAKTAQTLTSARRMQTFAGMESALIQMELINATVSQATLVKIATLTSTNAFRFRAKTTQRALIRSTITNANVLLDSEANNAILTSTNALQIPAQKDQHVKI